MVSAISIMGTLKEQPIVHLFTICYNEQILLPYFLRHYEGFVHKMYFFDNYSTDQSAEIISNHKNAVLIKLDTKSKLRDDLFLEVKNNCWKDSRGKADFVIVCDVDEFLYHVNMKEFLLRLGTRGYSAALPIGYNMVGDGLPISCGQIYQEIFKGVRTYWSDKLSLFDPNMIREINFSPGCHKCNPRGVVRILKDDPGLKLLHYHYLDQRYIIERHKMYAERLSNINRKNAWGFHYLWEESKLREIFRLHQFHAVPVFTLKQEQEIFLQDNKRITSSDINRLVLGPEQ